MKRSSGWLSQIVCFSMMLSLLAGCSALKPGAQSSQPESGALTTPPAPMTPTPLPELQTPFWQYVRSSALEGLPALASSASSEDVQKKQSAYFVGVFKLAAQAGSLHGLSDAAVYVQRGLLEKEKVTSSLALQYKDGIAAGLVFTQGKSGKHTYFVDAQGGVFELYLLAQSTDGSISFERNPQQAPELLKNPALKQVRWVTARSLVLTEWSPLSNAQKALLQGQYEQTRVTSQPEKLEDAMKLASVWLILPVISWDAADGKSTVLLNPASLNAYLESNPAYQPGGVERGIVLGLPANILPAEVTAAVAGSPAAKTPAASLPSPTAISAKDEAARVEKARYETALNELLAHLKSFQSGEIVIDPNLLFKQPDGSAQLGMQDDRPVEAAWGFYVQGIYLGYLDVKQVDKQPPYRIIVLGFSDPSGNRFWVPFQLGVDLARSVTIITDPQRTTNLLDNERPLTLKAGETSALLDANLKQPVLVFLMRTEPPYPLSESDGAYLRVHEAQYPVAERALIGIRANTVETLNASKLPNSANTFSQDSRPLALIETLIVGSK